MNIAAFAGVAMLLLAAGAAAQQGGKAIQTTPISLGTATPGGGFPLYGNAFAEIIMPPIRRCRSSRATPKAATRTFRCWKKASSISRWSPANPPMRPSWELDGHAPH